MKSRAFVLAAFSLLLGASALRAQGAAPVQAALAKLKPAYFWTFDRGHRSVGSAGPAALQLHGGRFVADADGKDAAAQGFDLATDGLVFEGDPVGGGGQASAQAKGVGSVFLLFRVFDKAPRGQRHLFSQGGKGTETQNALALFIQHREATTEPGALTLRVAGKQVPLVVAADLAPSGWHFFAMSWDEARPTDQVKWWFGPLGGEVARSGAVALKPEGVIGNNGPLAIGFSEAVDSSAYRELNQPGAIDALAFFDRELKDEEVSALAATARRR